MPTRNANATWEGTLQEGSGSMALGSGAFEGPFSFRTRFGDDPGTNPEELIGAAHAGCFSMQFSALLENAGTPAERVETEAKVHLEPPTGITRIELTTRGRVPGIDADAFQRIAEEAKQVCPVSKALAGVEISLEASLES